jgi:hypothetical protein
MAQNKVRLIKETKSLQLVPKYGSLMSEKNTLCPPSRIMKYGSISVTLMSIYIHRMRMLAQAVMLPVYK